MAKLAPIRTIDTSWTNNLIKLKMSSNLKRILIIIGSAILMAGLFLSGFYFGLKRNRADKFSGIMNAEKSEVVAASQADFEPFWKVWSLINEKYPNGKVSDQEKVWGAISGLASSLGDPYTVFFPPSETKLFKDTITGEFGGVGMEVGIKDNILTVIAPLKNTPAYAADIKTGDKIFKIDDTLTADLTIDKAVSIIRGPKGTKVKLSIVREGESEPKEITIVRDIISAPTLDTEKRADGIFVIKLYSFSANSTFLFRDALREFIQSGDTKLILDMRGNPGGYLDAAVDIASWFLPIGKTIVSENFGEKSSETVHRSKGYNIFNKNLKMIILVDGGSASASEILAGALNEHGIAKLVGDKTYGKGSVQELINITDDTALKVTVAKWFTPNGVSISEKGLEPDVKVKVTKEDLENKIDPQLNKALELLK